MKTFTTKSSQTKATAYGLDPRSQPLHDLIDKVKANAPPKINSEHWRPNDQTYDT